MLPVLLLSTPKSAAKFLCGCADDVALALGVLRVGIRCVSISVNAG